MVCKMLTRKFAFFGFKDHPPGSNFTVQVPNQTIVNVVSAQAVQPVQAVPATLPGVHVISVHGGPTTSRTEAQGDINYMEKLIHRAWWTSCFAMMDVSMCLCYLWILGRSFCDERSLLIMMLFVAASRYFCLSQLVVSLLSFNIPPR